MMTEVLIPIASFIMIAVVVKIISDHKIRRQLIEKGLVEEKIKYLYPSSFQPLASVKWGLVLIGIGAAFLIGRVFERGLSEEITVGLMFLFAGIGFIIYYVMAKKQLEESGRD
jgi:hypothetical protein